MSIYTERTNEKMSFSTNIYSNIDIFYLSRYKLVLGLNEIDL